MILSFVGKEKQKRDAADFLNNIFWLGKIRLCGAKNNTNQHIWAVGELAVWVVRDDGCTTPKGKKQTESTKTNASFFSPISSSSIGKREREKKNEEEKQRHHHHTHIEAREKCLWVM